MKRKARIVSSLSAAVLLAGFVPTTTAAATVDECRQKLDGYVGSNRLVPGKAAFVEAVRRCAAGGELRAAQDLLRVAAQRNRERCDPLLGGYIAQQRLTVRLDTRAGFQALLRCADGRDREAFAELLRAHRPPEVPEEPVQLPAGLSAAQVGALEDTAKLTEASFTSGDPSALQSRWEGVVADLAPAGSVDVNALVQWVLRESYLQTTEDLRLYAEKVQYFNDLKGQIRDELTRATFALAGDAGSSDDATIEPPFQPSDPSDPIDAWGGDPITTKAELETYIENLEEDLNSVGDDAQLANVDLQNILQKQQQTLQMLSNISKMLHDTAMAIIRKIGG